MLCANAVYLGSVDGHSLQIDELKGTKPTKRIDLKETEITNLMCAATRGFCQRPSCSLIILAPPLTRSLFHNNIGAKGAYTLAAVLKETQITHLECAAAPECVLLSCSAPIDTTHH